MTASIDGVREHYRASGLIDRLKVALRELGPEDQKLAPQPSLNLSLVMGAEFGGFVANLGRNLMEDRLGILTVLFERIET